MRTGHEIEISEKAIFQCFYERICDDVSGLFLAVLLRFVLVQ